MNSIREQQWPTREPPPNFTARAVDAMLASVQRPRTPRRGSRTILYLALAALFASGSALAFTWSHYHQRQVRTAVAAVPQVTPAPTQSAKLPMSVAAPVRVTSAPVIERKATTTSATARPTKSQPKAPKPSPPLRTPACECERGFSDFICDCY